jgi:Asp/Glu/hydantoin racemase
LTFDEWIKTPEADKVILGCPPQFAAVIHNLRVALEGAVRALGLAAVKFDGEGLVEAGAACRRDGEHALKAAGLEQL